MKCDELKHDSKDSLGSVETLPAKSRGVKDIPRYK